MREWTTKADEWYARYTAREDITQEEKRDALFRELDEGSRRNKKLMAKLTRKLKTINGERE